MGPVLLAPFRPVPHPGRTVDESAVLEPQYDLSARWDTHLAPSRRGVKLQVKGRVGGVARVEEPPPGKLTPSTPRHRSRRGRDHVREESVRDFDPI